MIDRTELDTLLAQAPVVDGSLGEEALRDLEARLNRARTALQVELTDAESRHAARADTLDAQRTLVAKCEQVIATLEGGDREGLLAAAKSRRDVAAAEVVAMEATAAEYALLSTRGPEWLGELTIRMDALTPHLGVASERPAASPDGAPDALAAELASLEASLGGDSAGGARTDVDAATRLQALMAEQGVSATAAPEASDGEEESVADILAGLPELVEVADDDVGDASPGTEVVPAKPSAPVPSSNGAPPAAPKGEAAASSGGRWRAVAVGIGSLVAAGGAFWWLLM